MRGLGVDRECRWGVQILPVPFSARILEVHLGEHFVVRENASIFCYFKFPVVFIVEVFVLFHG